MKLEKLWREAHDAVLSRVGRRLWWLKVACYPKRAWLANADDRCSLCKTEWYNVDAAINHVTGLPHFRQWCVEHSDLARKRFPETVLVIAADVLVVA